MCLIIIILHNFVKNMDNISVEKCPSIIFFIVLCLQFLIEVFLMFHNFLRKLVLCHVFVGFFSLSRLYIAKSIKRIQYFVELYVVVCHFLFNRIGILFYAIAIYSLKKVLSHILIAMF